MSRVLCYEYEILLNHSGEILEGLLYPSASTNTKELRDFILEIHELDTDEVRDLSLKIYRLSAP